MAPRTRFHHEELEFARALTFFDAIFAFSVTLLITTVDDFEPTAWTSLSALWDANGSALLAYAISFVVVLVFWRANHRMFSQFAALDSTLITVNCVAMFGIVLIPFTTEAMGKAALSDLPLPTALYALNITFAFAAHSSIVLIADARGVTERRLTRRERIGYAINFVPLPLVFLASIPVAYAAGSEWAQRMWILVWPVTVITGVALDRWLAGDPDRPPPPEEPEPAQL